MLRRSFLLCLASLLPSAVIASILPTAADPFVQARRTTFYKSDCYERSRAECWHITSQKTAVIYFPDGTIETYPERYLDLAIARTIEHNHAYPYYEFIDGRAPTLAEALHI